MKIERIIAVFAMVLWAGTAWANDWSSGVAYTYDGAGNITAIGTDRHVYDWSGRLVQSDTQGIRREFSYDAHGNRTGCTQLPATDCHYDAFVDAATNRLTGAAYDPAGNVTALGGHSYTYDAFNMQTRDADAVTVREYIYTADDERIAVYTPTNGAGTWRWSLRDASGKVLRELTSRDLPGAPAPGTDDWAWRRDYVYRDALLLASRQFEPGSTTPTTYHYHLDHLGTARRITDATGRIVGSHSYHAFGPETSEGQKNEPALSPLKYTGHERDGELDYMHARYYDGKRGRFLSVDPVLDVKNAMRRPQMWNRYAYALNNPVRYTDPDGRLVRLEGTQEDQQKLLDLIRQNLVQKDRSLVTLGKNGMLQVAGNAKGSSVAFTMLKSAIQNKNQTIGVGFAQTALVKPGAGPVRPMQVDLQNTGGGLTTKAAFTMSGNIEVRVDPRGNPQGESLSMVMGHELLGHGWDLMFKGTSSEHSARNTENLIRLDLGLTLRPNQIIGPWPDDPEH